MCPQGDDFLSVLNALAGADAYVVAAPAYLLSANGSLKKFLDRGLQFYAFVDRLWGKPAVGVAIAGIEGMEGSTKRDVESFIKLTMGDLRGSAAVYGALPGEVLLSSANRQVAEKLARALLEPAERISPRRSGLSGLRRRYFQAPAGRLRQVHALFRLRSLRMERRIAPVSTWRPGSIRFF
jgi:hypothetical protein